MVKERIDIFILSRLLMIPGFKKIVLISWMILSGWIFIVRVQAQDLEPRLLSPIPTRTNILLASYAYSSGNILVDNTLPIEDLNANINNLVLAYVHSFKLFNKLAKVDVVVPYAFGDFYGVVNSIDSSATKIGFADPLIRLSMILVGTEPVGAPDFFKQEQKKFRLGAFIRVRAPLGQYDPTKLLNLGANRWAVKSGLAGSYTFRRKFVLEGHLDSWFFSENKEFYNGNTSKQESIFGFQLHATYLFKPGIWLSVSGGRAWGGEIFLNDVATGNLQNTSRLGAAFAVRLSKHHGLKIAYTNGLATRFGSDFDTFVLAYQFIWLNN